VSYETQVLAINLGLNNGEETAYSEANVHGYGISLDLLVEPGYLLNQPHPNEAAGEHDVMLIEGKLSVSF